MTRVWLLALLTACSGGSEVPEKPPITVVSPETEAAAEDEHATAAAGRFDEVAFPCCEPEGVAAVVTAYDALTDALAADDASGAAGRASELQAAAKAAAEAPEGLSAEDTARLGKIGEISGRMVGLGTDMEGLRAELVDLVEPTIGLALDHQGGASKVAISYCPMATPPGRWLQDSAPLANPYYGSKMLRCGVFETREEAGFAKADEPAAEDGAGAPDAPAGG